MVGSSDSGSRDITKALLAPALDSRAATVVVNCEDMSGVGHEVLARLPFDGDAYVKYWGFVPDTQPSERNNEYATCANALGWTDMTGQNHRSIYTVNGREVLCLRFLVTG